MGPERVRVCLHVAREPGHVDVDQKSDIGLLDILAGLEADEARAVVRDVGGGVALEHADAGKLRQLGDELRRARVAPGIAGDQDRVLGLDEPVGKLLHQLGIGAARSRESVAVHGQAEIGSGQVGQGGAGGEDRAAMIVSSRLHPVPAG